MTKLTPNSACVVRITGPLVGEIANTFQPAGNSTNAHVRFGAEMKSLLKIAEPVMGGFVKKGFTDGYRRMKELQVSR